MFILKSYTFIYKYNVNQRKNVFFLMFQIFYLFIGLRFIFIITKLEFINIMFSKYFYLLCIDNHFTILF